MAKIIDVTRKADGTLFRAFKAECAFELTVPTATVRLQPGEWCLVNKDTAPFKLDRETFERDYARAFYNRASARHAPEASLAP